MSAPFEEESLPTLPFAEWTDNALNAEIWEYPKVILTTTHYV